jgi:hypothetical protein
MLRMAKRVPICKKCIGFLIYSSPIMTNFAS